MLAKKIAYNTIISAGARVIGLALSLIIIGLLTRYLGKDGFGQYATILAFLYIFLVLADLGLYSICVREISKKGADETKIASNAFTIRIIAGLIFFLIAALAALFFPYSEEIKKGILIGAVGFWFLSNHQVLMGVFQKYLRMDKVALSDLISRLSQLILILILIYLKLGFLWIVLAYTLGAFINFSLVLFFARQHLKIRLEFDFLFWKKILKESVPLGIATILTMIYFKLDTVMLSVMKTSEDVGIYSLPYRILESLLFFSAMFVGLVMPLMSKYALDNKEKFKKIVQKTLDILIIFIVPLVIITIALSSQIIVLIAGSDFLESVPVLNILIIATAIIYVAVLFSNMIIALGAQKYLVYIYGLGALINVGANLIFIPKYSYLGAAATTLFTELITSLLMLGVIYYLLKYALSFKFIFKTILAAVMMIGVIYLSYSLNFIIIILLALITYFLVLYLMGGFSKKEVLMLIGRQNHA